MLLLYFFEQWCCQIHIDVSAPGVRSGNIAPSSWVTCVPHSVSNTISLQWGRMEHKQKGQKFDHRHFKAKKSTKWDSGQAGQRSLLSPYRYIWLVPTLTPLSAPVPEASQAPTPWRALSNSSLAGINAVRVERWNGVSPHGRITSMISCGPYFHLSVYILYAQTH